MLANQNPDLYSAAETLYQLNMDEQFCETVDRFVRAQARENAMNRINAELTQENTVLTQENTVLTQKNTVLTLENTDLKAEVARLQELLNTQDEADVP